MRLRGILSVLLQLRLWQVFDDKSHRAPANIQPVLEPPGGLSGFFQEATGCILF
jgi:hypothetical protein